MLFRYHLVIQMVGMPIFSGLVKELSHFHVLKFENRSIQVLIAMIGKSGFGLQMMALGVAAIFYSYHFPRARQSGLDVVEFGLSRDITRRHFGACRLCQQNRGLSNRTTPLKLFIICGAEGRI